MQLVCNCVLCRIPVPLVCVHFCIEPSLSLSNQCDLCLGLDALAGGNQGAPPGLSVDVLDLHSKMRQKAARKELPLIEAFFFWYPKIHDVSIETDNCCEILGPKPSKATGFPHSLSILFLPKKISIGIKSWEIAEGFPTMPSRIVWSASKGFGSWRPAVAKWPFDPFWNEVNYMWKSMKI